MLVLTRKLDDVIQIGDQRVTIRILQVQGGRVRLGIEAAPEVSIRRQELVEPVMRREVPATPT